MQLIPAGNLRWLQYSCTEQGPPPSQQGRQYALSHDSCSAPDRAAHVDYDFGVVAGGGLGWGGFSWPPLNTQNPTTTATTATAAPMIRFLFDISDLLGAASQQKILARGAGENYDRSGGSDYGSDP